MTPIARAYLDTGAVVTRLLGDPAVAERWKDPSALPAWTVGGLAGHLAWQLFFIPAVLAEPVPAQPAITLQDYYGRVRWIGAGLHDEANARIRRGGEETAADGQQAVAERAAQTLRDLCEVLPGTVARTVRLPVWGDFSLTLDDFLTTRLLELVVHADDLAVSVDVPPPDLAAEAVDAVVGVLGRLAVRRHGQTAVVRALARAERAPDTIAAF